MRVDDIQGHHIKSRRAAGSSTAMGTPVADPGVRPAIRRLTDRYPALCLLALTLAGQFDGLKYLGVIFGGHALEGR